MKFSAFQSACRYVRTAYDNPDDHTRLSPVCRNRKNVPPGNSWGKCDEAHCPFFGIQVRDVAMYCDGKLIGKAETGTIHITGKEESGTLSVKRR